MFGLKLVTSFALAVAVTGGSFPEPGINNQMCGVTYKSRSVDGVVAEFDQPWRVELRKFRIFSSEELECGGILVSDKFVLTAARCVEGLQWLLMKVRIGDHGLEQLQKSYPYEEYRIRRIIIHEDFETLGGPRYINDIALIELFSPVRFRKHSLPACLPRNVGEFVGKNATVSEMGFFDFTAGSKTFSPRKLDVEIIANDFCTTRLPPHRFESNITLCGKFQKPHCRERQTLAGLPLIQQKDGRAEAIGIASWSKPCYIPNTPYASGALTMFTKVSSYMDWIHENMEPKVEDHELAISTLFFCFTCVFCLCIVCLLSCSK